MKAMLFAAGLGTRLKPFTENHPKALAQVNHQTLLERNIKYLKKYGIQELIINIHHFGEQIVEYLNQNQNFGCKISISDEKDQLLETGGGLLKAASLLGDEPFLVMNADILTDLNLQFLIQFHQKEVPLVSLAVSNRDSSRKLYFTEKKQLVGWGNEKTKETIFIEDYREENSEAFAFSGIHIIDPQIFSKINFHGKFSIMTVYLELMDKEKILGYKHSAYLIDVGKPEAITQAEKYFV